MPFIGEAECLHPFLWKCGNQISVNVTKIPVIIFLMYVYIGDHKGQKRLLGPMNLELQVVMN